MSELSRSELAIAEECIAVICTDCERRVALHEYPGDNNLYHINGGPCRAYLIRRLFDLYDPLTT